MTTQKLTKLTLWSNRVVMVMVLALTFVLPGLLRWYCSLLNNYIMPQRDLTGIWVSYIPCACVILFALWNVEMLLQNLFLQKVFVRENVRRVRRIQWCCCIVALVCVIDTIFALPMLLLGAIMGFLSLVVSVLAQVLESAVALQEENDLTI
jgi:hypothetical protein